jgi:NAD(P)-dependent dehydrogenase (short-subunit alcohol dehydrogenase family)
MINAIVTGASRGVGKGIAISLAEAGWRILATGRTIEAADLPAEIVRVKCDHLHDEETEVAIAQAGSHLRLLVNCAWGGYERMSENGAFTWGAPFWQQPLHRWQSMMDAGVRAAFVASSYAAPAMIAAKQGLIVNISHWAAKKFIGNTIYGVAKAATDKLTADIAHELRPHGVAVVSLYPGLVRTELVLEAARQGWFDLSKSESPEFTGRVIAALARDPNLMQRSGSVLVAAQVANELRVTDIDGSQPVALTLQDV